MRTPIESTDRNHAPRARAAGFSLIELLVVIGIIVLLASLVLAVSGSVIRANEERATRNTLTVLDTATEEYERTLDRRISYRTGAVAAGGVGLDPIDLSGSPLVWDIWSNQPPTSNNLKEKPPQASGVANWGNLPSPYGTISNGGLPSYSSVPFRRTAQLIWELTQAPSSAAVLQQLPESVFRNLKPQSASVAIAGVRHCVDSWDTPIIAVFPGRDARLVADPLGAADAPANIDADGTIKCDSEWAPHTAGGMRLSCKNRRILWASAGNNARFIDQNGAQFVPSPDNLYSYEP